MSFLKKYWGSLRRLRFLHWLYNLTKYGRLKKNKGLYEKYGIDKSVVSSIAHKDISNPGKDIPWLDRDDAKKQLTENPNLKTFPIQWQEQLLAWPDRGVMILENFASAEKCDKVNADLERIILNKELDFDYTNSRVMNAWKKSETVKSLAKDQQLHDFLSFTLGKEVVPFQTISFLKGSRQKTHSDFIHMTTEPVGYLIATWMALEDIAADSGPLHYYPGSHKLPYILGEDFDHDSNSISVGDDLYGNYEKEIAKLIAEKKLQKEIFLPKKGDLLIWHANLLHGGEQVTNENSTRRSLVTHYFCKGEVVCYHEITQRPAVPPTF
ncbi:MAG TPA: phytanoyl-CoA dioxygenase family protein [Bacteroidia bacterium]|jgi:ectoine hydroxylase-related dioxygenase (phytanoyl-CoA dioxygenase family)|nr:phytanoyl-CoA dioxygenase family protein [Bacteroidia bacterium]